MTRNENYDKHYQYALSAGLSEEGARYYAEDMGEYEEIQRDIEEIKEKRSR